MSLVEKVKDFVTPLVKKDDHNNTEYDHKLHKNQKEILLSWDNTNGYHLVLSGGGLRGFAHIGIYKALVEYGYQIDSVAGTSMGALVGIFIAAKKTPREIEELFSKNSLYKLMNVNFSRDSMFSVKKIQDIIEKKLGYENIEDLPLAMSICVTNYTYGKVLYAKKGKILPYVMGSCALPGLFEPVTLDDSIFIDGGVFDNFPVSTTIDKKILGSHVNPRIFDKNEPLKDLSLRSLELTLARDISEQKKQCEIFFEPSKLVGIGLGILSDPQEIITIGYEYACSVLTSLQKNTST